MSLFNNGIRLPALALSLAALSGCGGHTPDRIAVNKSQSVVMDAPVLSAGVIAERPDVSRSGIYPTASAKVTYGQERQPLTLHYRFLWYDAKGLDILPHEPARTLTLSPGEVTTLLTRSNDDRARLVRLYLYL